MSAINWFHRTCGKWTSERRYLFAPALKPVNMTTEFEITNIRSNKFQVDWTGKTAGQMILTLEDDVLHRSRDYFGDGANSSTVEVIDHVPGPLEVTECEGLVSQASEANPSCSHNVRLLTI